MITYQIEAVEPFPLDKGDEIVIDDQHWIVDTIQSHYGGGRGLDTVESVTLTLLTVNTNEQGGRMKQQMRIYPHWYVKGSVVLPMFKCAIAQKQAWKQVWVLDND